MRLTPKQIYNVINDYIGVSGGYLGDFTYKTHQEFYPRYCNLNINPLDIEGMTTKQRFQVILEEATSETQVKILQGVLRKYPADSIPPVNSGAVRSIERYNKINDWIRVLMDSMPLSLKDLEYVGILGEGYFSIVKKYKVRGTSELRAVKELRKVFMQNPDYIHWFEREISLLEQLKGHHKIIDILGSEKTEKSVFYITPMADTNLYKYIKENNQSLKLEDRINIFEQILEAIVYAHSQNVLHRDINPNNVLIFFVEEDVIVKVSDFGLGKDIQSQSGFTRSDMSNFGQLYYVAPEQRDKLKHATVKSDVFSLGKLLNFVMTGKDPDALHPSDFKSVVDKATKQEPNDRYHAVLDLQGAFIRMKNILLQPLPPAKVLMRIYIAENDSIEDWNEFHQIALQAEYRGHVFLIT